MGVFGRAFDELMSVYSRTVTYDAGACSKDNDYFYRYPGDEYVDVFGLDHYYEDDPSGLLRALRITVRAAKSRGKVAALTEFGRRNGLSGQAQRNWLSRSFFEPVINDAEASRIAFALAWRNADQEHFFLPYRGHPGAADLRRICDDPRLLLERDLSVWAPAGLQVPVL